MGNRREVTASGGVSLTGTAKARIVKLGSQYSTAEAYVYDKDGALVASGRGTYFTAQAK